MFCSADQAKDRKERGTHRCFLSLFFYVFLLEKALGEEEMKDYLILTNNPLVREKLDGKKQVLYMDISYEDILKEARDRVYEGHRLLSHPLSGSVKPNETPYKSIMTAVGREAVDAESVRIIEAAIQSCGKFQFRSDKYKPEVYADFQLIDWTLLESALASADA